MPVVAHKYTNIVFAVAAFSQGHVAAVSAEIYTCVWEDMIGQRCVSTGTNEFYRLITTPIKLKWQQGIGAFQLLKLAYGAFQKLQFGL